MAEANVRSRSSARKFYPNSRHHDEFDPADVPDVYASVCRGDCLEPVYHDGECLVFSRADEPEAGDFVGLWLHPAAVAEGELPRRVKRLYMAGMPGMTLPWIPNPGDEFEPVLIFEQLNPRKLLQVRASRVIAMHKVIGKAEPMGDGTAVIRQPECAA